MRVRVAGLAWMRKVDLGPQGLVQVKDSLTIVPRKPAFGDDDVRPEPIRCWSETPEEIGVPRGYFFESADRQHDIDWDLAEGRVIQLESKLRQEGPYAEQGVAVQTFLDYYGAFDRTQKRGANLGGILKATTGFGKTNTALELIRRIGRTTLVVVHKEFLQKQWVARIRKFLPGARVGIVQGPKCEWEDKDIVIAMAQSLAREDGEEGGERYPEEFYRHFGVLIVDEVHRVGAATWSPIPGLFPARYRLGLSATPRRKDGADKVFWWHLGQILYAAKTETPKPHVRILRLDTRGPAVIHQQDAPRGLVLKLLSSITVRNRDIVAEIVKAMQSPAKRKVMILSDRLEHLRELEVMLRESLLRESIPDVTTDFYVGEWFTDGLSFSLLKRKTLDGDREQALDVIYAHFRRAWFDPESPKKKPNWRCAETYDGKRYVALYKHGFRPVSLDELTEKGILAMAKDYGVAQDKPQVRKRYRTDEELAQAERARVIFATYQMCSEGIDIPAVDTIGFAAPVSDIEQAYGRARRNCVPKALGGEQSPEDCLHLCPWRADGCQGKPHPVAFDIVDQTVPISVRANRYRLQFYKDLGAKVTAA